MSATIGKVLTVTLFGESHGSEIGAIADGFPPDITVSDEHITANLARRGGDPLISTARREPDRYRIVSGVNNGKTTGAPLCVIIPNEAQDKGDYRDADRFPRPGHADYAAFCKFGANRETAGGGIFSGRLTAPLTVLGTIAQDFLATEDIRIGTHILSLSDVGDNFFSQKDESLREEIRALAEKRFPVLSDEIARRMIEEITRAKEDGDSVGGILETAVCGLPAGCGEPWFDSVESVLSHALFSIPGIKGVSFGEGFDLARMRGSAANDPYRVTDGKIVTSSLHNGGILGGMTYGMPVLFRCAVKPTPSVALPQQTVDLTSGEEVTFSFRGRHDPAIIPRVATVVDAVTALVFFDLLLRKRAGNTGEST